MSNQLPKGNKHATNKRRKFRKSNDDNATQNDLIFGLHAIQAALELPVSRVTEIYLADERHDARADTLINAAKQHASALKKWIVINLMKWHRMLGIKVLLRVVRP